MIGFPPGRQLNAMEMGTKPQRAEPAEGNGSSPPARATLGSDYRPCALPRALPDGFDPRHLDRRPAAARRIRRYLGGPDRGRAALWSSPDGESRGRSAAGSGPSSPRRLLQTIRALSPSSAHWRVGRYARLLARLRNEFARDRRSPLSRSFCSNQARVPEMSALEFFSQYSPFW